VFWRIALPLTGPALAVVLVFEVQAVWTDLMKALIYLRDSDTFTIPRGLKSLVDAYGFGGEWHWEIIVTASVITTIPLIIVFFLAQKRIIDGVASTGLKG
jgi:multiple sugar transport system permease protein